MSKPDLSPPVKRMLISVEYDGTGLVGWQRQENGPSVQAYLEQAAEKLTTRPTLVQGSGRTDAGVHATGQAAHLDVPAHLNDKDVVRGLNAWLQTKQVAVLSAQEVPDDFHARFDAVQRAYLYRLLSRETPSALRRHQLWHHRARLDVEAMHNAAQSLVGRYDFTSFRAAGCQANSPIRTMDELSVICADDEIHITARARSFLYHQIRNITGSLVQVGIGKWSVDDFIRVRDAKDRSQAGPTAPAHGLYLTQIDYQLD